MRGLELAFGVSGLLGGSVAIPRLPPWAVRP